MLLEENSVANGHALCEYVLTSVFIDRDGEVCACCHKQPISHAATPPIRFAQEVVR